MTRRGHARDCRNWSPPTSMARWYAATTRSARTRTRSWRGSTRRPASGWSARRAAVRGLTDLVRADIPAADFLVMAGGGRVVDLNRAGRAAGTARRAAPTATCSPRCWPPWRARSARCRYWSRPATARGAAVGRPAPVLARTRRRWSPGTRARPGRSVIKGFAGTTTTGRRRAARTVRPPALSTRRSRPSTQAGLGTSRSARPEWTRRAGWPWSPRRSASTPPTSWCSATCPTTCRCSAGPGSAGWPSPTPHPAVPRGRRRDHVVQRRRTGGASTSSHAAVEVCEPSPA